MNERREFQHFSEMVQVFALNDGPALVLGWWRRVERTIDYYFIAHRGVRRPPLAIYRQVLCADPKVGPGVVERLDRLRSLRNAIAHERIQSLTPEEASEFAYAALELIGILGNAVPDELAISSGAAEVA